MTSSEWKPIADAPLDGTVVKVSCVLAKRGGRHIEKCKWESGYWMTAYFRNRFAGGIVDPTHFMLLDKTTEDNL
jgi:hypothetical protein